MAMTWESPIKSYLSPYAGCMKRIQPQLDLADYDSVRDNAKLIDDRVNHPDENRRMPPPTGWKGEDAHKRTDYKAWVAAGCPLREWSKGSMINGVDSTPLAPAATVFKDKLYVFWTANGIYFSSSADGKSWPDNGQKINGADSTPATPAACKFKDNLYLFWKASDWSNGIYFSSSADGKSWPNGQKINGADSTPATPAACEFKGNLYLFWKANDSSDRIYFSASADGKSWPNGKKINDTDSTRDAPAVCAFKDRLYLFWRGVEAPHRIYFRSSADGSSWSEVEEINQWDATSASPACCVAGDQLYLFFMANNPPGFIYWSRLLSRGDVFADAQVINRTDITHAPLGATGFNNKPYLFWKADDNRIYFSS